MAGVDRFQIGKRFDTTQFAHNDAVGTQAEAGFEQILRRYLGLTLGAARRQ